MAISGFVYKAVEYSFFLIFVDCFMPEDICCLKPMITLKITLESSINSLDIRGELLL